MSIYQNDDIFTIRDILDSQLESSDKVPLGRVADIGLRKNEDGTFRLHAVQLGPEALARRIGLGKLAHKVLRGRFEHEIAMDQIKEFGPTLKLRGKAGDYDLDQAEKWIARYILRWIPGSGYHAEKH